MYENEDDPRLIASYLTLRRAIGILGLSLPWLLLFGGMLLGAGMEDSISDYYGTAVRDILVGVLFAIAWFLFSYRGYERKDDIAGDLAWLFALGVALLPSTNPSTLIKTLHFVCAASLLLVLAYFSLFLFTKTKKDASPTGEKKTRNKVYVTAGILILACIVLIGIYYAFFQDSAIASLNPVFWLETFALTAFGVSWMVKGEMFLTDETT